MAGERVSRTEPPGIAIRPDPTVVVHAGGGREHGLLRRAVQVEVGPPDGAGDEDAAFAADQLGFVIKYDDVGAEGGLAGLVELAVDVPPKEFVIAGHHHDRMVVDALGQPLHAPREARHEIAGANEHVIGGPLRRRGQVPAPRGFDMEIAVIFSDEVPTAVAIRAMARHTICCQPSSTSDRPGTCPPTLALSNNSENLSVSR